MTDIDPYKHLDWARDIVEGAIPSTKIIRRLVQRHLDLHDQTPDELTWDEDRVSNTLGLIHNLKNPTGYTAGQPLVLRHYQRFMTAEKVGWRETSDLRRNWFTRVLTHIPRQNGKSMMDAIFAAVNLVHGEPGTEILICGPSAKQAGIIYRHTRLLLRTIPAKQRRRNGYRDTQSELTWNANRVRHMTGNLLSAEGVPASVAVFDEAALIRDAEGVRHIEAGQVSRDTSYSIMVSTSQQGDSLFRQRLDEFLADIEAPLSETRTMGLSFVAETREDCNNPKVWKGFMPALGDGLSIENLIATYEHSKESRSSIASWEMLNCNRWSAASDEEIFTVTDWTDLPHAPEDLAGPLSVGVDLAATTDLASVRFLSPLPDGTVAHSGISWVTQGALDAIPRRERSRLDKALSQGTLRVSAEPTIDHIEIAEEISTIVGDRYHIICFDPAFSRDFRAHLDYLNLSWVAVAQKDHKLSAPLEEFRRDVIGKRIIHDHDPMMLIARSSAIYRQSETGITSLRRRTRVPGRWIDPLIATIVGYAGLPMLEDVDLDLEPVFIPFQQEASP